MPSGSVNCLLRSALLPSNKNAARCAPAFREGAKELRGFSKKRKAGAIEEELARAPGTWVDATERLPVYEDWYAVKYCGVDPDTGKDFVSCPMLMEFKRAAGGCFLWREPGRDETAVFSAAEGNIAGLYWKLLGTPERALLPLDRSLVKKFRKAGLTLAARLPESDAVRTYPADVLDALDDKELFEEFGITGPELTI